MPKKSKQAPKSRDEGKTRFELRFDDELYAALKKTADDTDISVNQLMQGITRWALKHAHPGEEPRHDGHDVEGLQQPGCIWFGHGVDFVEDDTGKERVIQSQIFFTLDFTERHVVREPDPSSVRMEEES